MDETTKLNQMIQQHILEHELRLKHVDELLDHARRDLARTRGDATGPLESAERERDELAARVAGFKLRPPGEWSKEEFERTGPMVVWDTLAQKLEKLVERLQR